MKVWQSDNKNIKLIQGDCLEVMDKLIEKGVKVDAIITDPPYGTTACKWDSVIPFDDMWERLKLLRNDNTPIVLFGSEPFSSALRMSNIKEYKYDWIWEKSKASNFLLAKKQPLKAHEIITLFYKKQSLYNPQKTEGKPYNKGGIKIKHDNPETVNKIPNYHSYVRQSKDGKRNPRSVQYFKTAEFEGKLHPTQKPTALLEYLIKTYTDEGDLILDFTMGSGTTGVACKNLNRKFIGIELEEKYFDIAVDRIKNTIYSV